MGSVRRYESSTQERLCDVPECREYGEVRRVGHRMMYLCDGCALSAGFIRPTLKQTQP
jgi:hypothetical protein